MKRIFLTLVIVANLVTFGSAQILDGIYENEHVPSRRPVPYYFIREADMMWTKRIWRIVDLREKINHPLYYPIQKIGSRMSLIDLLLWGIKNEGLVAYKTTDDRFTAPMTTNDIDVEFDAVPRTVQQEDPETGQMKEITIQGSITSSEVKQYMLKEEWFFDRQRSSLDVRIIGLCPIRFYKKSLGTGQDEEERKKQVFWIYFPEARRILANHEVFNPFNDSDRKTFDDIFFKRRFSSFAVKQSNVYDDREIMEYRHGVQAMLEAEKIRDMIFKLEVDLWEY